MNRSERGCEEHSNPKLTGVCSSCLRDKLSELFVDSSIKLPTASLGFSGPDSPNQPLSSQSSSNYVSPDNLGNLKDSVSSMFSFKHGLKKSRSITLGSTSREIRDGDVSGGWGSKKNRIWTKLLKFARKGTRKAFMHSRTTVEGQGQA